MLRRFIFTITLVMAVTTEVYAADKVPKKNHDKPSSISKVDQLSQGVFLLIYENGEPEVIRFVDEKRSAYLEKFSAYLVNELTPYQTPKISILDTTMTQRYLRVLETLNLDPRFLQDKERWLLATLAPFYEHHMTGKDYLTQFNISHEPHAPYEVFLKSNIPTSVSSQLLDLWAFLLTVGMSDFHAENWLIDKTNRVVPIDVGFLDKAFQEGIEDVSKAGRLFVHPFSGEETLGIDLSGLQSKLSPEMTEILTNLTISDLMSASSNSGLKLESTQFLGILKRRNFLLKKQPVIKCSSAFK